MGGQVGVYWYQSAIRSRIITFLVFLNPTFPRTWSWIPDNIATLDSDSPDTKRLKNINFEIGLGFATDLVPGIAKFLSGSR